MWAKYTALLLVPCVRPPFIRRRATALAIVPVRSALLTFWAGFAFLSLPKLPTSTEAVSGAMARQDHRRIWRLQRHLDAIPLSCEERPREIR